MPNPLLRKLARIYPNIAFKLRQAGIVDKPEIFLKKSVLTSLYLSFGVSFSLFLVLSKSHNGKLALLLFPIILVVSLFYILKVPDALIKKKEKEISREIVFAGRFLLIEIGSGVPLYNAFLNISKNYPTCGKYFKQITDKVNLGTSMEDAINDAIELTPSNDFRRILWQIINAQYTGADIGKSLNAIIEQISREQNIMLKEYGRKLNPLAMFYMIIAVIVPSLSITFLIILSSMLGLELNLSVMLFIAFMLAFVQFMFLSIIKFLRPAVDF